MKDSIWAALCYVALTAIYFALLCVPSVILEAIAPAFAGGQGIYLC